MHVDKSLWGADWSFMALGVTFQCVTGVPPPVLVFLCSVSETQSPSTGTWISRPQPLVPIIPLKNWWLFFFLSFLFLYDSFSYSRIFKYWVATELLCVGHSSDWCLALFMVIFAFIFFMKKFSVLFIISVFKCLCDGDLWCDAWWPDKVDENKCRSFMQYYFLSYSW